MKKEILINNKDEYKARYIISKKKFSIYFHDKKDNYRYLVFFKNYLRHRNCNLGPQSNDRYLIEYNENNKTHNLYGPAIINKTYNSEQYRINFVTYTQAQFQQYINILNNLSYKRTY